MVVCTHLPVMSIRRIEIGHDHASVINANLFLSALCVSVLPLSLPSSKHGSNPALSGQKEEENHNN